MGLVMGYGDLNQKNGHKTLVKFYRGMVYKVFIDNKTGKVVKIPVGKIIKKYKKGLKINEILHDARDSVNGDRMHLIIPGVSDFFNKHLDGHNPDPDSFSKEEIEKETFGGYLIKPLVD